MSSRLEITSLDHYEENDNIKSIKVGIDLSENTGVIIFPTGSIAERPTNPEKSSFRFNTQTRKLEYYYSIVTGKHGKIECNWKKTLTPTISDSRGIA